MNVYEFDKERARREEAAKLKDRKPSAPPLFNLPGVLVWLGGVLVAIHLVRAFLLPAHWDALVIYLFAFWPVKYAEFGSLTLIDAASAIWAFLSYSLLHGSTMHIVFNLMWMGIFGTAVARRFGTARFLALSALCAVGGAFAHLASNWGESAPMLGASAAVSGHMAAALRFVFERGGPLGALRGGDARAYHVPAQPLADCFRNRQVLVFVGIWFGLNLLFGLMSGPAAGQAASVAWQAHIGGFVAGLVLFPLFDPVPQRQGF